MIDTPFTSPDGEPLTQGVDEKNVENDENEQPNIIALEKAAAHTLHDNRLCSSYVYSILFYSILYSLFSSILFVFLL